ncbi:glycoside hydrolase family 127 protein [Aspergillus lucknowensis]|uniref:Glycoside hydrolase family 127 protein n=1 Tax=Aspergillus lucknowensis TaxID=176173 RepID=A0ABR4LE46_9EURO
MTFQQAPVRNVDITSRFWSQMQRCSKEKTIPAIIKAQKSLQHWYCLTWKEGHEIQPHPFWDSDIYKIVEAACYFLMKNEDQQLMATVEEAVDMIRAAQHPDGYINSYYTVLGISKRWTNLRDMHELYCLGHLTEACVAYETLTNSGRLLEPVLKALRHVDEVFGSEPGKKRGYPGHQEIEIGLLRLYELSGEPVSLKLAKYFICERGRHDANGETYFDHEAKARGGDPYDHFGGEMKAWFAYPRDYSYNQADRPLIEATEVKGHAVRAMYYYIAATDLVRLTGDKDIKAALDRMWTDMTEKKLYITGGIGAMRQWEGFGAGYVLGDTEESGTCYAETCACFALILWCQRMLQLDLNVKYADVMEIGLYNGFLGAVGLDGGSFYYQNPLRTHTGHPKERSEWFEVACCPPNVAKLLASMGSLIYSFKQDVVAIHLYIESAFSVPGTDVVVSQTTNMPWSGDVHITVTGYTALALRIPTWADEYTSSVQGEVRDGYLYIPRSQNLDLTLSFMVKARKIYPNPALEKDEVCIMRGPLVYCIEDVDNDVDIDHVGLLDDVVSDGEPIDIAAVNGVIPIKATGRELVKGNNQLYASNPWKYGEKKSLLYVPYFLRANRGGNGGMTVWAKRLNGC